MDSPSSQAPDTAALDKILRPTFQQVLEEAELLSTSSTPQEIDRVLTRLATLKPRSDLEEGAILKVLKRRTGAALGDLRATLKARAQAHKTSMQEDFGRRLADATLATQFQNGRTLVRTAGSYWRYTGTHWARLPDDALARAIDYTMTSERFKEELDGSSQQHASALSQATLLIRARTALLEDPFGFATTPKPIINCANGEVHLTFAADGSVSTRFQPHTPDSYLTHCLRAHYDPQAPEPEVYDQTLLEIFDDTPDPEGMARHWNEVMGYAIQPTRTIPAWFLLKGEGKNGKSKLVETLTEHLMGLDTFVSTKLDTLDTSRSPFALSQLVGKLVVLDEDMNKGAKLPDGLLKSISERKVLKAEFKGKDPFPFTCLALPILLSNHWPHTSDHSYGMSRRANVIPFTRQFLQGQGDDPQRFPYIWRHELSGVLNRALEGMTRVLERGYFLPPAPCKAALQGWLVDSNPVLLFLTERCERKHPTFKIRTPWKDLYAQFATWQSEQGIQPRYRLGKNSAKQEFQAQGVRFVSHAGVPMVADLEVRHPTRGTALDLQEVGAGDLDFGPG